MSDEPGPSAAPCCASPDAASPSACVLCAKAMCGNCSLLVNGKPSCAACRDALLAELKQETAGDEVPLARPAAAGLAAALACGGAWGALGILTDTEIGYAAVGVGWAVAHAMRRASGGKRARRLARAAMPLSLLALLLGKYLIVAHAIRESVMQDPSTPPDFTLSLVDLRLILVFVTEMGSFLNFFDLIWVALAFITVQRVLAPASLTVTDARGNPAPAA